MKNMKTASKLTTGFAIVIALAILIGGIGIFGMYQINAADDEMYEGNYMPTVLANNISQKIVEQRVYLRNFVIYDVNLDSQLFQSSVYDLNSVKSDLEKLFTDYDKTAENPEDIKAFADFLKVYRQEWLPAIDSIYALGVDNQAQEAKVALVASADIAKRLNELTTLLQDINLEDGKKAVDNNTGLFNSMFLLEGIVMVAAIGFAIFLVYYISSLISKPLIVLTSFMNKAGTTGDISLRPEDLENLRQFSQAKDEVGQCIGSTASFINHLTLISQELEMVANGDLTIKIDMLSEQDTMGVSMQKMVDNLNNMFGDIRTASDQVSAGAGQVSHGAQELASGSSQQAASVEELSASLSELKDKTDRNAVNSENAREANSKTAEGLADSIRSMGEMLQAMKEIDESSQNITRVIKVIEDIARQTNILALNAAVEAARAGQHGKGFAVVAEEVRSLAGKSAEAAKETSALIEGSSQRVKLGNEIVSKTNAVLEVAVDSAKESTHLIDQVATASAEQAHSINEINQGMEQISTVVQANSATAQESAAASEEMSAQAVVMNGIVAKFKLRKDSGSSYGHANPTPMFQQNSWQQESAGYPMIGGKY